MWLAAAKALPGELAGLGNFLRSWTVVIHDSHGEPRLIITMLILGVAAFGLVAFVVWWRSRVKIAGDARSRFSKALRSFGVFLALALFMPLASVTLLEAAQVRMIELSYALAAGILVGEFGRAVALAAFAPDDPPRRLITIDDATARSLARHLTWGARGLGVLIWTRAIHQALVAPPTLIVATNTLFALFICALLLHLLWAYRASGRAPPWLRALGWLSVAAIATAVVAGCPAVGSFIAARLVSFVAVFVMLYLLVSLGNELFTQRLALDAPHSHAIAADFGVSTRRLSLAIAVTGAGVALALSLAALVLYVGPW
jgi:hypothetical protein